MVLPRFTELNIALDRPLSMTEDVMPAPSQVSAK
jgi:hypothetical protein